MGGNRTVAQASLTGRSSMRALVLGVAIIAAGGCTSQQPNCSYLDSGYGRLTKDLRQLQDVTIARDARQSVERCYSTHPYLNYLGPFSFVGAKRASSGRTYLVYEPQGITDVELVFELGRDMRPVKAFQHSTL
jgi:hypothetical protein